MSVLCFMSKNTKTTTVSYKDTLEEEFKDPSKYYIQDALGDFIYFHTSDRKKAQEACDKLYGKGHYKVRSSRLDKSDSVTCRGSTNSKSRAGSYVKNIHDRQIRGLD
jgi:hypothetical protein